MTISERNKEYEPRQVTFSILRPGGNDTALVDGIINDPLMRKSINDKIMKAYPNVEQVGFYEEADFPALLMAGGEFCGNALRSLAYTVLKGQKGEKLFEVSGIKRLLKAGITSDGKTFAEMPIPQLVNPLLQLKNNLWMVELEGITHLITKQEKPFLPAEAKKVAKRLLEKSDLIKKQPAAGVMFVQENSNELEIIPIVWVRDIQTLFYETACASGTTAVALWKSAKRNTQENFPIKQPSGSIIEALVTKSEGNWAVTIAGQVTTLQESIGLIL